MTWNKRQTTIATNSLRLGEFFSDFAGTAMLTKPSRKSIVTMAN